MAQICLLALPSFVSLLYSSPDDVIRQNTIQGERIKASQDRSVEKFLDGMKRYLTGKISEMSVFSFLVVTQVFGFSAHSSWIKRR